MKGLTQIYTGDGKGKTTAAFGLALRASGRGLKVAIFQFLKDEADKTGEVMAFSGNKTVKIFRGKQKHPMFGDRSIKNLKLNIEKMFKSVKKIIKSMEYDIVILDEINNCVGKALKEKDVINLMKKKPTCIELVLTGRGATKNMIKAADLVTNMSLVKHPYDKGIGARKGIEF